MKRDLLHIVRCPICSTALQVSTISTSNEVEIREASVTCTAGHVFAVKDGIIDLLPNPEDYVVKEKHGLDKFAHKMKADGFVSSDILNLFSTGTGAYWDTTRLNFNQLTKRLSFSSNASILDIGANNCWASAEFSKKGLRVTALDISDTELQGLKSADQFIEKGGIYFERVMSIMSCLPFQDSSFDYIFCSAALHHNKPKELQQTLNEIFRVLRNDGVLLIMNEPIRGHFDKKIQFGKEVEEYEGNENIYSLGEYQRKIRTAGFTNIQLLPPESFYSKLTSTQYKNYASKNLFLKTTYSTFVWLYSHGLSKFLQWASYQPIAKSLGGLPLLAIVKK